MNDLKLTLKTLIVQTCDRNCDPASIGDDETLFGTGTRLALDSIDALQLSMMLQKKFGLRLTDSKKTYRILTNVGNLAAYLKDQGKADGFV